MRTREIVSLTEVRTLRFDPHDGIAKEKLTPNDCSRQHGSGLLANGPQRLCRILNRCPNLLFASKQPNYPADRKSRSRNGVVDGCSVSIQTDYGQDTSGTE
jgi:hypothetical protein